MRFLVDAQLPRRLAHFLNTRGQDADFVVDHLARGRLARLRIVAVGNAADAHLLASVDRHLDAIVAALDESRFVELHADRLVCRPG